MVEREPPGWRNLRVGIFFLVTTVVLFAALFVVGTNARLFERKYHLTLHLANAQQIGGGAMVALAGYEVGKVSEVRLNPRDDGQVVEIILQLPRDRQEQITTSSRAQIRTVGVLGDRFIDISMGRPGEPPLPDGAEIEVDEPMDWPSTFQRAAGALDDMLELIESGKEALSKLNQGEGALGVLLNDADLGRDLKDTGRSLAGISRGLEAGEGSLGRLLEDETMARRLERVVARVDSLTEQVAGGEGLLARLLSDEAMGESLARAVANVDSLSADLRGDGTVGRLIRQDEAYRDLQGTLEELHGLISEIKRNPQRYLSISLF